MALCHFLLLKLLDETNYLTNFLIELRQKIPYERGIKIISPRRASPPNRASSPPYEQPVREGIQKIMGEKKWKDCEDSIFLTSHEH